MTEQQFKNPITGEVADESISEKEAKQRGYFTFEFLLRHLEDENEFVKIFIVNGKKIVVNIDRPNLQYRKPVLINHERVLQEEEKAVRETPQMGNIPGVPVPAVCDLDDEGCVSCSG